MMTVMRKTQLSWLFLGFVAALLHGCGGGASGPPPPPPATHLSVTGSAAATVGAAFNVTVSALDASGHVVSSYVGTVHFASSDPQAALPADSPLTNGTQTFSVTLKTVGNQTVTVSDSAGRLTSGTTGSVAVSVGTATQLSVTTTAANATAGTAFNITVTAQDAGNNVTTAYAGTVHLISSDPHATLPADATLTNGTGTFSVTLKTASYQTVTATDRVTASITGALNSFLVNPGPTTQLVVVPPALGAVTTGFAFNAAVNSEDAFGNTTPSYTGIVRFTSSDAQATLPPNSALTGGSGTFSLTLKTLGPQTVTATDTVTASLKGISSPINVVTNAATHLSFTNAPGSSLTRQTMSLTVNALDAANNQAAGYAGTVHFTSSDPQAKLPADTTFAAGTATVSATLETAGMQTIAGTDKVTSSAITGSAAITVTAASDLAITNSAPPAGTTGQIYAGRFFRRCVYTTPYGCRQWLNVITSGFGLTGQGGVAPYAWSWAPQPGSSLPPGLNVGDGSGTAACRFNVPSSIVHRPCIFGTPTQPGTYNVVVRLTDGGLPAVQTSASYSITINNPPPPAVNTSPPPPPGVENQPYSYTFTASGYGPFTWSESGALPTGLAFDNNSGTLSGTPTETGSFPITVTATDPFKQVSTPTNNFTIVVTTHGFTATGSMATARRFHTATLLNTGKVLITGGEDAGSTAFSSAELYDPSTGTFTPTKGNMAVPRVGHTATLLNDGKVLITGGATDPTEAAVSSAEIYDPTTDSFTATTGSMIAARVVHTATLLSDGTVLVAGGDVIFFNGVPNAGIQSLSSAEIYNPNTMQFTATAGAMTVPRESHTATLLSSGKVLIAGGSDGTIGNPTPAATLYATAELYDPSTGHFTKTTGMLTTSRDLQTANLLSTGKVLIAGGASSMGGTQATSDLFDSNSQSFTATGVMATPRYYHDATALSDGRILVTGGSDDATRAKSAAEVYDPTAGTFASTGSMIYPRVWHTSTLLSNGKVLITGGAGNDSVPIAICELFQ